MAGVEERIARLARQGIRSIRTDLALRALDFALAQEAIQAAIISVDWPAFQAHRPSTRSRFLSLLTRVDHLEGAIGETVDTDRTMQTKPEHEHPEAVEEVIRKQAAELLMLNPALLESERPLRPSLTLNTWPLQL